MQSEPGANLLDPQSGLVVWWLLSAALWIALPVGLFVFARRFLRAFERRSIREAQLAELSERMHRLEARLDDVIEENGRLREDQRFVRQLLSDRDRQR